MPNARLLCIGPLAEAAACARAAERAGYRAVRATAAEAAQKLGELRPDAVLVWADEDVVATLEAVRAVEGNPLVVVVGETKVEGADAVIAQAGDPALLLAEVDALLAGHKPAALQAPDALAAIDQVLDGEMQTLWSQLTATTPAPVDVPHWRAATQVLAKKPAESPAAGGTEPGAFAAHVRQTLSAIEQRLFPDSPPQTAFATPPVDDVLREIDLDALGAAAMPVPEFEVSFDDEDAGVPLITPQVPSAPTPEVANVNANLDADVNADADEKTAAGPEEPVAATATAAATAAAPTATETSAAAAAETVAEFASPLPERGNLLEHDLPRLLHRIHRDGFTGRLRVRHGNVEKSLYFEQGLPVYATSSLPQDRMGDLLYREGKITRAQLDETRRLAEESGRRVGQLLVDLKFLKASELFPTVRRHVEDILYSLFAWSQGDFELHAGSDPPHDQKVRLLSHPDHLIVEGIRRKVDLERLVDQVGAQATRPSPLSPDLAAALCDVNLEDDERAMLPLLDGVRSIAELIADSHLDEVRVYQLVYGLCALNLLRLDRPEQDTLTDFDDDTPTGVVGQPPLLSEASVAIDRERIAAKHAACAEGDYFAVLGLRTDASDHEIRRAFEEQRREFAAERFAPTLREACAPQLREIAEVLSEAWTVLRDRQLRAAYRAHLRDAAGPLPEGQGGSPGPLPEGQGGSR